MKHSGLCKCRSIPDLVCSFCLYISFLPKPHFVDWLSSETWNQVVLSNFLLLKDCFVIRRPLESNMNFKASGSIFAKNTYWTFNRKLLLVAYDILVTFYYIFFTVWSHQQMLCRNFWKSVQEVIPFSTICMTVVPYQGVKFHEKFLVFWYFPSRTDVKFCQLLFMSTSNWSFSSINW